MDKKDQATNSLRRGNRIGGSCLNFVSLSHLLALFPICGYRLLSISPLPVFLYRSQAKRLSKSKVTYSTTAGKSRFCPDALFQLPWISRKRHCCLHAIGLSNHNPGYMFARIFLLFASVFSISFSFFPLAQSSFSFMKSTWLIWDPRSPLGLPQSVQK